MPAATSSSLLRLGNAFSPWGALGEVIAAWLHYRVEVKRVEVELQRVHHQAQAAHRAIHAQLQVQMEELARQRRWLEHQIEVTHEDLRQEHLHRQQMSFAMQVAMQEASGSRTAEERAAWLETVRHLSTEIRLMGDTSTTKLELLTRGLPALPSSSWLLNG